jgi:putative endopeptidase
MTQTNRRNRWTALAVVGISAAGSLFVSPAEALDSSHIDTKADPRVDFVRYSSGIWLDNTAIPDDRPAIGSFDEVDEPLQARLATLVTTPQNTADGKKLNQLYAQAIDFAARDQAGLSPIKATLKRIKGARTLKQLFSYEDVPIPIAPQVIPYGGVNILTLGGPGLPLQSREAYLQTDKQTVAIQEAYISFLAKELQLSGYTKATAKKEARRVFLLEKRFAKLYLDPRLVAADTSLVFNPVTVAELQKTTPSFEWTELLSQASLKPTDSVVLTEPQYIKQLDKTMRGVPLTTVKAYVVTQLLAAVGPYLSSDINALAFAFTSSLTGQQQPTPPVKVALRQATNVMSDTVGQLYAEQFFGDAAKKEITAMTQEIIIAFRARIAANAWMSAETKAKAVEKLDKVKVRVAYPDRFISYDDVQIGASYAESITNFGRAAGKRELAKVGKPTDQSNWGPVALVNAFYNPLENTINFPAGILAGVFFDVKNDPAANFGAIGAVIGHELTHGFDVTGSQFDGDGQLKSWWTQPDLAAFDALNAQLASQFSAIELPGVGKIDGTLTVGENVADLGGVQVAFDALNARLAKGTDPGLIDGLSQKQRFFVAYAQTWKGKARPEFARFLLTADVHSPDSVRAVQPLRNMNAFFDTFGIKEGDPMWLPPAQRLVIW